MSNPYDPAKEPELTLTLDPFAQEVPTMEQPQAQMPAEKKEEPKPIFDESQLTEQELADQGIRPNTIRLSIGTEHIDDILADLQSAFEAVR